MDGVWIDGDPMYAAHFADCDRRRGFGDLWFSESWRVGQSRVRSIRESEKRDFLRELRTMDPNWQSLKENRCLAKITKERPQYNDRRCRAADANENETAGRRTLS